MNKETIYIESGDDITDILSHLKTTDKKIVAIVPPKKSGGILSSSVNIKLLARTARAEKKVVVLITTDDSLTKLAMAANLPVAPSLKSRPVIPEGYKTESSEDKSDDKETPEDSSEDSEESEESPKKSGKSVAEDFVAEPEPSKIVESETDKSEEEDDVDPEELLADDKDEDEDDDDEPEEDDLEDDDDEEEKSEKKHGKSSKKSDKPEKKKGKKTKKAPDTWFGKYKTWIIFGSIAAVLIIAFLVWAFKFAPFVSVSVSVRTSSGNFSQNVSFTKNSSEENATSGVFYAHEEKSEKEQVVKFTATGEKDVGEKASGTIGVYAIVSIGGSVSIPAGSTFTYKGLNYVNTTDIAISGPTGKSATALKVCDNYTEDFDPDKDSCRVSTSFKVTAAAAGDKYNLGDTTDGWETNVQHLYVSGADPMTGGSSKLVTVVQQSDVDEAMKKLTSESSSDNKSALLSALSETSMPIDASFKVDAAEPTVSPAVGEEVKDGVTPTITAKTSYSILTIDTVRVEEFITSRANLGENERLYSLGSPFIEYFSQVDDKTYTGKLKTTYKSGPKISETEVLEKVQGEKIGRIEPVLKDAFSGISSVSIEKSYFWVNSVPSDPNKVKVSVEVEE